MKFRRNQPRSQPIVRVARLEAICMVYPVTRPLQGPLSPNLTVPPEHQVRRGKTTMSLMFLPTFRWKRVKAGCQRFYRRR
jgi:hypothetical protein